MEKELRVWLEKQKEPALQFLKELVEINSYTSNIAGVNQVQDIMENEFSELGLKIERIKQEDCGDMLIATSEVSADQDILLSGHVDTVHSPESAFNSFDLRENKAFGPGVLDMKGGITIILWALKAAHFAGVLHKIPLRVVVTGDEEIRSIYSGPIICQQAEQSRAALVFEWERAGKGLINKRKGIKDFQLEVRGKSAHAGNAHQEGRNAVVALAKVLLQVDELTNYDRGITTSVGTLYGGQMPNMVSDYAACDFEVRANSNNDIQEIDKKLGEIAQNASRDGISATLIDQRSLPALVETEASLSLFRSFQNSAERAGFDAQLTPHVIGGGSDASLIGDCGIPCLDGLGPFGEGAHTEEEYIVVDSLWPKILSVAFWLSEQARGD